jgi:cellulose synthase operon protein YhjQ
MIRIALVSLGGGNGRSTLTASLTRLAARGGHWALAVECDPQNLLGLHFGLDGPPADGLASRAAQERAWNTAALAAPDGALILPFGSLTAPALVDWQRQLIAEPDWLGCRLNEIERPHSGWTFMDAPRAPSILARQSVRASDAVLLVLHADSICLSLLDAAIEMSEGRRLMAVVNAYDPSRALQTDILGRFFERLGERLCPYPVHRDEAVPEAFAHRAAVIDHAPHSQVAHDLHGLLRWIGRQSRAMKESVPGSHAV